MEYKVIVTKSKSIYQDEIYHEYWYKPNSLILHRENGPAYIRSDGRKEWWQDGKWHRIGGPAIEYSNGEKHWYQNGQLHREDGPAIEWADGYKRWYLFGTEVHEQDVKDYVAKKAQPTVCDKVIEINGQKFKLVKV